MQSKLLAEVGKRDKKEGKRLKGKGKRNEQVAHVSVAARSAGRGFYLFPFPPSPKSAKLFLQEV
jgi:hypothetical protein